MRIALIIGIPDYTNFSPLPACRQDAEAIENLLAEASSFDHTLCLTDSLAADEARSRITSYLEPFRGQQIDQALFYFSGHGDVQGGELLYLLSDFDEKRPNQTSLGNEEVDGWLRDLAPKVTVKITDCCHSGMAYVKEPNSIERALDQSKGRFASCYFIAASQPDEVTYAYPGEPYSAFTQNLLKGLSQKDLGPIHYKDLINIAADAYKDNESQRPYFVTQGIWSEVFVEQTTKTQDLLKRLLKPKNIEQEPPSETPVTKRSLLELIESDAKAIVTAEQAAACLEALRKSTKELQLDQELTNIFEVTADFL